VRVEEALALGDEFPVRREPRPIVLMDAAIGPGQLPRIEDRERVLGARPVVSDVALPPGMLERLQPAHPDDSEPVRVTKMQFVWPEFRTDRGHRPLPAYRRTGLSLRSEHRGREWAVGSAPCPRWTNEPRRGCGGPRG
jgi:hypothetical protein